MPNVNVTPVEIETTSRHGDLIRADVYLPKNASGPFPVVFGASPYQKALRHLPVSGVAFAFIEYGPMQLYLDNGYAYVAMDVPGTGRLRTRLVNTISPSMRSHQASRTLPHRRAFSCSHPRRAGTGEGAKKT